MYAVCNEAGSAKSRSMTPVRNRSSPDFECADVSRLTECAREACAALIERQPLRVAARINRGTPREQGLRARRPTVVRERAE